MQVKNVTISENHHTDVRVLAAKKGSTVKAELEAAIEVHVRKENKKLDKRVAA